MGRHSRRSDHHQSTRGRVDLLTYLPLCLPVPADCTLLLRRLVLRRLVLRLRRRGGKPQAHVSQLSGDNTK